MTQRIEPLGDGALLIRLGDVVDAATNARALALCAALAAARVPGIRDVAPAYASVCVRYDIGAFDGAGMAPAELAIRRVADAIAAFERAGGATAAGSPAPIEIPVCYGGAFGPDLDVVAEHARLRSDEVVERHAAGEYRVAMLGFMPGFAYLLGLDAALQAPRRSSPRTRVPAGSVAIGGAQTGIYPRELPGGWQLIGRTPLALFDPRRSEPALLRPGQAVRFRAIDAARFAQLDEAAA